MYYKLLGQKSKKMSTETTPQLVLFKSYGNFNFFGKTEASGALDLHISLMDPLNIRSVKWYVFLIIHN